MKISSNKKLNFTITLFFVFNFLFCQINNVTILGSVLDKKFLNDTIGFVSGSIPPKYYQNHTIEIKSENGNFKINQKFDYPQMYSLAWSSEKGRIIYHEGYYFLDNSTSKISIDTTFVTSNVIGNTFIEFSEKFSPYILKKIGNEKKNELSKLVLDSNLNFENALLSYTQSNPDSYVSLWFLIKRFNLYGYHKEREVILSSFSKKTKASKLWKITNSDFKGIKIKNNSKFPELLLKNTDLKEEKLKLSKTQYTLIDFWFSRCKPCLQQLPSLIESYNTYKNRGFNVIGISVDNTKYVVSHWQKRIVEKGIPWKNYLDENGEMSSKEKIHSFPTNYLLDSNGNVIMKNISPEDLEKLLKENLK